MDTKTVCKTAVGSYLEVRNDLILRLPELLHLSVWCPADLMFLLVSLQGMCFNQDVGRRAATHSLYQDNKQSITSASVRVHRSFCCHGGSLQGMPRSVSGRTTDTAASHTAVLRYMQLDMHVWITWGTT